ncbi:MAG: UDP-N-acetylmuramoyl-L-alanine--D-glutamate ligase [Treponema sp.]|nr:UDP-N-acetylmuramoyl-L-alanine--D-glutamate ligase [Treponema sp.]
MAEAHAYSAGCMFPSLAHIAGKKITVMGLGLNGGGAAAARFFLKYGAYVTVTDIKSRDALAQTIDALDRDEAVDKSRLTYHLGGHSISDFASADCVIKNPGVKYEGNEYLAAAKAIETDMSVFLALSRAPIIAVTGSKGKSSTVSAIHYGLQAAGRMSFLGGNITVSPLSFLEKTDESTPVVLELSSWQLADLRGRKLLKPKIALITKIVPDHLNWYGTMDSYIADKRLIYADQDKNACAIFDADADDEKTPRPEQHSSWGDFFASESKATVFRYSTRELPQNTCGAWQHSGARGNFLGKARLSENGQTVTLLEKLAVTGAHMRANALNAALVMVLSGIPPAHVARILGQWQGIPHRLQYFHTWKNGATAFDFYNDSCATVPESTVAALQSFEKPVILIAGGTDKGLSQNALALSLSHERVRALYLLAGSATDKLIPLLEKEHVSFNGPYDSIASLLASLRERECRAQGHAENKHSTHDSAHGHAADESYSYDDAHERNAQEHTPHKCNAAVVFSPGATSFGMFANEFARGDQFMEAVKYIFSD